MRALDRPAPPPAVKSPGSAWASQPASGLARGALLSLLTMALACQGSPVGDATSPWAASSVGPVAADAHGPPGGPLVSGEAVVDRLTSFAEFDPSIVPLWTRGDLSAAFERIRDERFLVDDSRPDWPRRLTWLHPQRGCEARAQLVADKLAEWGYVRPAKIFVTGELHAWTENDPTGEVAWDWHVAAAVRVRDEVFAFDPALEPHRPLALEEWLSLFSPEVASVRVAACDPSAFEPETRCVSEEVDWAPRALEIERLALPEEWQLQIELGRDPDRVLGEAPPWRGRS